MFEPVEVYLDHAAATPKRAEVTTLHAQRCERFYANPHGTGRHSTDCRHAAEKAADEILQLLRIPADEACLYWTSGGTEAANLGIQGAFSSLPGAGVAVTATAHACLIEPAKHAPGGWFDLPVGSDGQIDFGACDEEALSRAGMFAVCHINNETGVEHDLVRLREFLDGVAPRALLLADALQSAGKRPIPWAEARVDLVMVGGRKLGGPAGIGALIARREAVPAPLFYGGGQQDGVRPGTVDVVSALELAHALRLAEMEREAVASRLSVLNRRLREGLMSCAQTARCRIVSPKKASPWIVCAVFEGYEGAILTRLLGGRGIAVSAGSACSADSNDVSHVLRAMGIEEAAARGMVRVSFGHETTESDIDRFVEAMKQVLEDY
ncbi:MAG: cysteine desulfurase family protein [Verrucomicrobiota bacterium]